MDPKTPTPPLSDCCRKPVRVEGETTKFYVCEFCWKPCDLATPEQPGLLTPEELREIKRRLRQVTRNYTTTGTATPDPVDTLIDEDIPALLRHIATQAAQLATLTRQRDGFQEGNRKLLSDVAMEQERNDALSKEILTQDQWMREAREAMQFFGDFTFHNMPPQPLFIKALVRIKKLLAQFPHPHDA